MILQCFQAVIIPFQFFFAEPVVKIAVAGAADQDNPGMNLLPGEGFFVPLVRVAGAGDQVMPGQVPHPAAAQGACG